MYSNPSDRWDKKESKMDEEDMKGDDNKLEVHVHHEEEEENIPHSGIFCVWCHDSAIHIFEGNSLCHTCFNKEIAERIKQKKQ